MALSRGYQGPTTGAFFEYPAGVLAPSVTVMPPPSSVYSGTNPTYDRAVGRWLPAPPNAISPDGLTFAYAEYDLPPSPNAGMAGELRPPMVGVLATTGRVHLVDARSGADRTLFNGSPTYLVVGFTPDGVYLAQIALTMDGAFSSGLFLLDASGGTPQPVPGGSRQMDRSGWEVAGGAAWGSDFSNGPGMQPGNQLVRLDLKTGAVEVWLTRPESQAVGFLGLDIAAEPIVVIFSSGYSSTGSPAPPQPSEVWILTTPGLGKVIYLSSDPNASVPSGPAYTDSHGLWLDGTAGSVYLYTRQSGFNPVSVPSNGAGVTVAGTCQ